MLASAFVVEVNILLVFEAAAEMLSDYSGSVTFLALQVFHLSSTNTHGQGGEEGEVEGGGIAGTGTGTTTYNVGSSK